MDRKIALEIDRVSDTLEKQAVKFKEHKKPEFKKPEYKKPEFKKPEHKDPFKPDKSESETQQIFKGLPVPAPKDKSRESGIADRLDEIAAAVQGSDPKIALAIDQVSDRLEKFSSAMNAGYWKKFIDSLWGTVHKKWFEHQEKVEDKTDLLDAKHDLYETKIGELFDRIVELSQKMFPTFPRQDGRELKQSLSSELREAWNTFANAGWKDTEDYANNVKEIEDWAKGKIRDLKNEAARTAGLKETKKD